MLNKVLTVFFLLFTFFVNTKTQIAYATDVAGFVSPSQFSCMKLSGYSAIFTQIYSATNGGSVDVYGPQNVINAYQVGLATEGYINPAPQSSKQSYTQFDEAYYQLTNASINVFAIWLKVTDPVLWYQNSSYNINFIQGMITRARNYGITLGIYTNWYDWEQITGSTTTFQQYNLPLWYWEVYGYGLGAESPPNFIDFRAFGSWKSAFAKEYGFKENLCSAIVSKVVSPNFASFLKFKSYKNMTRPVAGSAIF
uniref:Glycoside hydrolase n=1 Tax=Strongyloides papillosus TaxID=174720 RepID=A0A0N5BT79_STREA